MSENKSWAKLSLFLLAWWLAGLIATAPVPEKQKTIDEKYPLPKEIVVKNATTKFHNKIIDILDDKNQPTGKKATIKIIDTKDIDFSKDFKIETDRYRLVKDDDWIPSRIIGHILSLTSKLIYWDAWVGWWLDEKRSKAVLAMLENNPEIKNLTVRINHNEWFYDWYRMMTQKDLRERNPFLYRLTIGTLVSFKNEIFAEFMRWDYYNPLTRTVAVYSNIESITAHEIGHHIDFNRFTHQWIYNLARIIPPVMVYQEWEASQNATKIMSKEDEYQFRRYLIPAFYTYLLWATISILKLIYKISKSKR